MIAKRALPSFRLIDGVIIATVALLGLKVLGLFAEAPAPAPVPAGAAEQRPAPPARQAGFGRVLSHARTNYDPAEPTTTGSIAKAEEPAPAKEEPTSARPAAPPLNPPSASERLLLERLGERREELQQRSREMEARERLLQEQERRLEERQGQLKASEDTQKAATATKSGGDPNALKNVVIMYETMKPKEAARVFDRLPVEVLLSVVTQMNSRKMAEILAAMTPENAEKLTVALARRANAPEEVRAASAAAALPSGELPAIERPGAPRR